MYLISVSICNILNSVKQTPHFNVWPSFMCPYLFMFLSCHCQSPALTVKDNTAIPGSPQTLLNAYIVHAWESYDEYGIFETYSYAVIFICLYVHHIHTGSLTLRSLETLVAGIVRHLMWRLRGRLHSSARVPKARHC